MAVDYEGRLLWHESLGRYDAYHGTAGSPLLYRDRLVVFQDHRGGTAGGAFIAAFDAATGRELWRTARQGSVGWSTPIAISRRRPRSSAPFRSTAPTGCF